MLKQIAPDDSGPRVENRGTVPASETICVMVPESLVDTAHGSEFVSKAPVAVNSYKRCNSALLRRLRKEKIIVVATIEEYTRIAQQESDPASLLEGMGKLLLLVSGEEAGKCAIPLHRCVDVMERAVSPQFFAAKINRALAEIAYDEEVETIKQDGVKRGSDLDALNEIGMALSTEKNLGRLLDLIVSKSRQMTWADAGSLYLIEADSHLPEDSRNYFSNKRMRFQVAQNDSRQVPFKSFVVDINKSSIYGYVALTQEPLQFEDVYHIPRDVEYSWGGKEFDASIDYRTMSMLTVPMINWRGEAIGVIQLINRKISPDITLDDPESCVDCIQPFSEHDLRMAMSIASQASIAIQNTELVESIRNLFNGFIDASVKAIEARDPTTAGHSQRVATLTVALAELVDQSKSPPFKDTQFSREQLQEIRYASLLHDFGKIGVREHVLVKAKKLYPHELRSIEDRFALIRTGTALKHSLQRVKMLESGANEDKKALSVKIDQELREEVEQLDELLAFVTRCNEPTVLAQGGFEQLNEIASRIYQRMDGLKVPFLTDMEMVSLSVPRGSLTEQDRKEIESHVTHTYRFLTTIPWTSNLRNVPDIAYSHHERLDGTGYPNRLPAAKIPIQSKMMSIADIFDALTASDRPYKKALPTDRALNILQEEANANHIEADLLELFISAGIYKEVLPSGT